MTAAGPAAGFALAAVVIAGVLLSGHRFGLAFVAPLGNGDPIAITNLRVLVYYLLFINILWGMVNLLPIHPLDGGQICREILVWCTPRHGMPFSLWISLVTASVFALLALVARQMFLAIWFGYFAYLSWTSLRSLRRWPRDGLRY